ncbi:MAG: hypothetical protein NXI32_19385 [bacterium]|nr:hypothetical protein [bacterium]
MNSSGNYNDPDHMSAKPEESHPETEGPDGKDAEEGGKANAPTSGHQKQGKNRSKPGSADRPVTNMEPESIARFVTSIRNPTQQIGEHVLAALQHADTVAVLTTIVVGPGGEQHIVSAALDPAKLAQVNALLLSAADEREEEETCIGFHCLVTPKAKPTKK